MKKKLLSLVCALALTISLLPAAQALEGEGTRAAEALASLGLVTGTGAGYAAEDAATQEQAAALLVRLLGAEKTAKADRRSCGWAGIPSWARSAVNYCAFHDLIDWSEYHAGGALDAELWCAMLLRALGYGSELGSSTARTALRIGLISRPLEGTLTRGDLFETALAALTGREAIDIDARIAEKAGCSIPEIFAKGGEAAFRALEREVTAACGALSGKLLLTGGGVVKTPENYAALHQNGRIYQLLRPLELLPTDGRPLSQGADLAAMWAERAPLYERFRDAAIDNSGTVEQTAQAIWRDFCENSGH